MSIAMAMLIVVTATMTVDLTTIDRHYLHKCGVYVVDLHEERCLVYWKAAV